ncbi:hypothetical protein ACVJGD_008525 [Bradyrhizobium sp. USDA 10063]
MKDLEDVDRGFNSMANRILRLEAFGASKLEGLQLFKIPSNLWACFRGRSGGDDATEEAGKSGKADLFCTRLDQIINLKRELVQPGGKTDWDWIDREMAALLQRQAPPQDRKPVHDRTGTQGCSHCASTSIPR